jgi:hypothetical protein
MIASLSLLVTFPVWIFIVRQPLRAFSGSLQTLIGIKTIVGYETSDKEISSLPSIKKGLLSPASVYGNHEKIPEGLNADYARDYKIINDFHILRKGFLQLGGGDLSQFNQ